VAVSQIIELQNFLSSPKQRNTREENKEIKSGGLPEGGMKNLDRLHRRKSFF